MKAELHLTFDSVEELHKYLAMLCIEEIASRPIDQPRIVKPVKQPKTFVVKAIPVEVKCILCGGDASRGKVGLCKLCMNRVSVQVCLFRKKHPGKSIEELREMVIAHYKEKQRKVTPGPKPVKSVTKQPKPVTIPAETVQEPVETVIKHPDIVPQEEFAHPLPVQPDTEETVESFSKSEKVNALLAKLKKENPLPNVKRPEIAR